jgi:outer membrane receptor protein involved in Fe transport
LWQVTDDLAANLTYYYQDQDVGGRTVNHEAAFGTGKYVSAHRFVEPYEQKNHLVSLEVEWDLGFATLTSATGVSKFEGDGQRDLTDLLLDFEYGYEEFPSFVAYTRDEREEKTFNQELRLVSTLDSPWNWIVGAFYNRFELDSSSREFVPGFPEFLGMPPGTPTLEYLELNDETFKEKAIFGELGYRLTERWQVTVGARWFDFDDDLETQFALPLVEETPGEVILAGDRNRTSESDAIYKFNTSYAFTDDVMTYLTVSQGYRRGGLNSGPPCEDPPDPDQNVCLLPDEVLIKPDTTVNYEIGLRSTWLDDALLFNAAVYFIDWDDIQVTDFSETGEVPIAVNGSSAQTRGIELSAEWQVTDSLRVAASYSYADAELTQDSEGLVGGVTAFDGDRLAGTPEQQGTLLVGYERPLANGWTLDANYGVTAQSDVYTKVGLRDNGEVLGAFALHSAAIGVSTDQWKVRLYADNLFDKFAITSVRRDRTHIRQIGGFDSRQYYQSMLRPLSVGLELSYRFDF